MENNSYSSKYPAAAKIMTSEEFEGLVDVFRTLLEWQVEAENDKGGKEWKPSSSTECLTGSKKKDIV